MDKEIFERYEETRNNGQNVFLGKVERSEMVERSETSRRFKSGQPHHNLFEVCLLVFIV